MGCSIFNYLWIYFKVWLLNYYRSFAYRHRCRRLSKRLSRAVNDIEAIIDNYGAGIFSCRDDADSKLGEIKELHDELFCLGDEIICGAQVVDVSSLDCLIELIDIDNGLLFPLVLELTAISEEISGERVEIPNN